MSLRLLGWLLFSEFQFLLVCLLSVILGFENDSENGSKYCVFNSWFQDSQLTQLTEQTN